MITVSYKDFISNNVQLERIEDELRNLFLLDNKIKLKEMDKVYTTDNITEFIQDISIFLKNEIGDGEKNIQDVASIEQIEQAKSTDVVDGSEYHIITTWWGKVLIFYVALLFITALTGWETKDFSRKYSSRYGVPYSDIEKVISWRTVYFPFPCRKYIIEYTDGTEKTVGYNVFGIIFITDEI